MYGFTPCFSVCERDCGDQLDRTIYWSPWQWHHFANLDINCLLFPVWSQWVKSYSCVVTWIRFAEGIVCFMCQSNPSCLTLWCFPLVLMLCIWVISVCSYLALTLTFFNALVTIPVFSDLWNMTVRIGAISVWSSLSNRGEISSGPWTLLGFSPANSISTPWTVIVIGSKGRWSSFDFALFDRSLRLSGKGFEKTDANCLLSMLAFDAGSEWVWPSEFIIGTLSMFSVFFVFNKTV